ncbi:bifunctional folylpolyglutamate synthase/dihydrofolate synthase [Weissella kandleri]|uniref:bifunctional folylpolyglutamate synthase/dihydrofolate synthase n=1 Tax=Weissella kandleri TaxID=1616 RepID=UPI00387EAFCF
MIQDYQAALALIHGRPRFGKAETLTRMQALLTLLGNPQDQLQYVHVTGTNGKGSVSRMTEQILSAHGLRVGLYTSPFIMRFNERIQINHVNISDADLVRWVQKLEPLLAQLDAQAADGPTEFETITALMFAYFAEQKVDIVVLEVGIGGLLDSTNIIQSKLVSVITTVAFDHQKLLGNTLTAIATQKAGIIKGPRHPTVVGRLPVEALQVIAHKTKQLKILDHDFWLEHVQKDANGYFKFDFVNQHGLKLTNLILNLKGTYQLGNSAVAIMTAQLALQALNIELKPAAVQAALQNVTWPGRFEYLQQQPPVVIDGAHNLAGVNSLLDTLKQQPAKHIEIIMGVLTDKDYPAMLKRLKTDSRVHLTVVAFAAPNQRQVVQPNNNNMEAAVDATAVDFEQAYAALQPLPTDTLVVFTGSLYFISAVRQAFITKKTSKIR